MDNTVMDEGQDNVCLNANLPLSEDESVSRRQLGATTAEKVSPQDKNGGKEAPTRILRSNTKKGEPSTSGLIPRFPSGTSQKRPLSISPDEQADPAVALKVASTSTRGRGKRALGAYSFLKEAKEYLAEGEESGDDDSDVTYRAPYRKIASPVQATRGLYEDEDRSAPLAVTVEALAAEALMNVAKIQGEVKKSGHLKGTVIGQINKATQKVIDAVEGLRSITPEEEQRRLRADNARLARELELMRRELRAFKEAYAEQNRTPVASRNTAGVQPGVEEIIKEAMEGMRRELLQSVGGMVNARLEDLEMRLPAEPVIRPHLNADQRQPPPPRHRVRSGLANSAMKGTADQPAQAKAAQPGPKRIPKTKARPTVPPPPPPPKGKQRGGNEEMASSTGTGPVQQDQIPQEAPWSKVVGRKSRGKAPTQPTSQTVEIQKRAVVAPKPIKIVAPKTAAIMITLKEGATIATTDGQIVAAKYAEVLSKARASISLRDVGLESVKIRTSMTGSKLMEVGGETPDESADRLAAELTRVVGDLADITRPTKLADLRFTGLDDSVSREELAEKVATAGGCSPTLVKVGQIRPSFWGGGSAIVRCPATAAKAVVAMGKMAIGWSMATITAVQAQPLRCYKCMMLGHTRALCPSECQTEVENGQLCFRCGKEGHKAATCEAPAKCTVCAKTGRPHSHLMGGAKCAPPTVKGKVPKIMSPQNPPQNRQAAEEDMQVS
ncbi:uncharacterized protein LOC123721732 [Papilio machaon]|uniref:uncharacterized protein LOC123721732 n=1 Tax=Papilio machaon TaxID=76193 RepID=UPI001E665D29|nr:uncharacterized protein LOC123721732 [Papilio machaon]